MDRIIIWADGGCRGNQHETNIGGWGSIMKYQDKVKEIYGGEKNTTNNKMEITACIKSLEAIQTKHIPIEFYCDSAYVVNAMNDWITGWLKNNWRKSNKKPVENKELWQRLIELKDQQSSVKFLKVKGHSDNEGNNRADELANIAMDELK